MVDYSPAGVTQLALVPEGTAASAFTLIAPRDIINLVLRIHDQDKNWSNPGKVTYKITITPPG